MKKDFDPPMLKSEMNLHDTYSLCPYEDNFESMVTKQCILDIRPGWTEKSIQKFLGSPCLLKKKSNYKYPLHLYHVECVLDAESRPDFQEYVSANKARQAQLSQAREFRKRCKACYDYVQSFLWDSQLVKHQRVAHSASAYICNLLVFFMRQNCQEIEISHSKIGQSFKISPDTSKRYFRDYGLVGFFTSRKVKGKEIISLDRMGNEVLQYFDPSVSLSEEPDQAHEDKQEMMIEKFKVAELSRSSHQMMESNLDSVTWDVLVEEKQLLRIH